jgi:hypothetical protein
LDRRIAQAGGYQETSCPISEIFQHESGERRADSVRSVESGPPVSSTAVGRRQVGNS